MKQLGGRRNLSPFGGTLSELQTTSDRLASGLGEDGSLEEAEAVLERIDLFERTRSRDMMRLARIGALSNGGLLVAQIGALVWGALHPISRASAARIHSGYYAGVATVVPVLFVAGLIEIVAAAQFGTVLALLAFAVPALVATAGALDALALKSGTPVDFGLNTTGLVATAFGLVLNATLHVVVRRVMGANSRRPSKADGRVELTDWAAKRYRPRPQLADSVGGKVSV